MPNAHRVLSWSLCSSVALLAACEPSRPADPGPAAPPAVAVPVVSSPSPPRAPGAESSPSPDTDAGSPTVVAVDQDRTLRALRDSLPAGWRLLTPGDRIIIERIEPVWVLWENRINAPESTETEAERVARIQRYGKRVNSRILYRAEAGWSQDTLRATREHNKRIAAKLSQLPDRHGVRHLIDASMHRKNNDPRIGAAPEELPRVEAYEAERKRVEAELRPLPAYLTQRYGLFAMDHEGWSDAYTIVHPYRVVEECYRLDDAVRALLAKEGTKVER